MGGGYTHLVLCVSARTIVVLPFLVNQPLGAQRLALTKGPKTWVKDITTKSSRRLFWI